MLRTDRRKIEHYKRPMHIGPHESRMTVFVVMYVIFSDCFVPWCGATQCILLNRQILWQMKVRGGCIEAQSALKLLETVREPLGNEF